MPGHTASEVDKEDPSRICSNVPFTVRPLVIGAWDQRWRQLTALNLMTSGSLPWWMKALTATSWVLFSTALYTWQCKHPLDPIWSHTRSKASQQLIHVLLMTDGSLHATTAEKFRWAW